MTTRVWMTVACCLLVMGETLFRDEALEGCRIRQVVSIPTIEFTLQRIQLRALKEIAANKDRFLQSTYHINTPGEILPKPTHMSLADWSRVHQIAANAVKPTGELVVIGKNAALRFRGVDGVVQKKVLAGRDPLLLTTKNGMYEILFIDFSRPLSNKAVAVYLRTSEPLTLASGIGITSGVRELFPQFSISVFIRNDQWFAFEPEYPYFNPFTDDQPVPTSLEGYGNTLACTQSGSDAYCEVHQGG